MSAPHLGLDELMIVNPGPVGARPCRVVALTPLARSGANLGCGCQGRSSASQRPALLLGDDGTVYQAVGRAVPLGRRGADQR